ncbi:MAG: VPLPA-CTERM sorting domain-containing protein [Roseinatronobacter sp.]
MFRQKLLLGVTAGLALMATGALADSISPEKFEATLEIGESITIKKTVTVDAGAPTTSRADVFFLVDTSGSMGGVINAVKTNASTILSDTAGFGDIAWGVGSYEDFPISPWGSPSDQAWRLNQAITTVQADVQTGINSLTLRSGNDTPESNLEALFQTASNESVGWRDGSKRFVIWFGDARGHDPESCAAQGLACTNPATSGYPGATLTATIAALNETGIEVIGVNRLSGTTGTGIDGTGQMSVIIDEVGGQLLSLAGNPAGGIVDAILGSLDTAFSTYKTVSLSPNGVPAGVGVEVSSPIVGDFDREETRVFNFEVTFTGLLEGVYDFTIDALVDGGVVATEYDRITVAGGVTPIPLPAAGWLLIGGIGALGAVARRRRKLV